MASKKKKILKKFKCDVPTLSEQESQRDFVYVDEVYKILWQSWIKERKNKVKE